MMYAINGNVWQVIFLPRNHFLLNGHLGMCDGYYKKIYIANDMDYEKTKEVAQHEIAHSISFECNMPLHLTEEQLAQFTGKYADEIAEFTMELLKNEY